MYLTPHPLTSSSMERELPGWRQPSFRTLAWAAYPSCGNGIVQDHENKPCAIINSVQESLGSGMIERRVPDGGNDRNILAVLMIGW